MSERKAYLQFWGKARGVRDGEPATHPAAYHELDVAAAADALLAACPRQLARIAELLGTSPDNARRCVVALIALHDIGKFSECFQSMVPSAWPDTALGAMPTYIEHSHHTVVALDLFERLSLHERFAPAFSGKGWDDNLHQIWASVACHHGKPMHGASETGEGFPIKGINVPGRKAAFAFVSDIASIFAPFEQLAAVDKRKLQTLSWLLAGLTNLADWIGSDRQHFPYAEPSLSLAGYWDVARHRALGAVAASGLLPVAATATTQMTHLFPGIPQASHLQSWAQGFELPSGPVLAIIEDVTGSGKTEAALVLATRLMAADRAGGAFFALPTMATANAMFDRLGESYRRMFDGDVTPSLVLAHGRSALHKSFTSSILGTDKPVRDDADDETLGDASSAVCAAWIADDRRKAFLAHIGVGTIDQAFLGVLPARHQALRLWGLADRVLIVDEAHAYDAYMGRELERLLEFHAALGGSAIILSATLPGNQRQALARAFARGLGVDATAQARDDYPLATVVSTSGTTATPVATRADRARALPVRAMPPGDGALAYVSNMARRGAAVAWIRNSVDDAIEAAEALRQLGLHPVLLHARFAMGDRLAIETLVRDTLGKAGSTEGRSGFVIVGTQILEQSLDYDVDAMVTDLAPVDLIIQRAGRLWRHDERTRQGRPVEKLELLVVAPDWNAVADHNWYRQVSPRAAAVYKHHGAIWRSAKALAEAGAIETPGGVRGLIETVYAREDQQNDDVPLSLQRAANAAVGEYRAQVSIANSNLLEFRRGYSGNNALWTADTITPTRLGDPVTVFRLGRIVGGDVMPWCTADDGDPRRSWALSEVSLSRRKAVGVPKLDAATEAMIEGVRAGWPEWEREQPLLLLDGCAQMATGMITDKTGNSQPVVYGSRTTGLRIVARP